MTREKMECCPPLPTSPSLGGRRGRVRARRGGGGVGGGYKKAAAMVWLRREKGISRRLVHSDLTAGFAAGACGGCGRGGGGRGVCRCSARVTAWRIHYRSGRNVIDLITDGFGHHCRFGAAFAGLRRAGTFAVSFNARNGLQIYFPRAAA